MLLPMPEACDTPRHHRHAPSATLQRIAGALAKAEAKRVRRRRRRLRDERRRIAGLARARHSYTSGTSFDLLEQ